MLRLTHSIMYNLYFCMVCCHPSAGQNCCERMLQGWRLVFMLLVMLTVLIYVLATRVPPIIGKAAEWQVRIPSIPTAFTGREVEVQSIVDFLVADNVHIVSVTGGPGYGKSSVAIATSHQLIKQGIPVCYVSLSEADSIDTFIMTLLHACIRETERYPDVMQTLTWVRLLMKKTVIVLDDADHLTLKETELRQEFVKLLKNMVAESDYLHLVAITRYRFKITSDFEEIHLQPLANAQSLSLLRCLIDASRLIRDEATEEQLQMIINETGGIPLAIKIIGRLLKSEALSVAELVEELSINPVNTLSEDSFTPDEQLKRCINLSYRYLSKPGQQCFLYAASFPGSFDRLAKKHIVANLTEDGHCLNQLVHRSLVEYSAVTQRYTVHALLRAFARDMKAREYILVNFYQLYAKYYLDVLTKQVTAAKSIGNFSSLYTTLVVDYHNFLQLLNILSNNSMSSVALKDEMDLALEAFQIMQARFPHETLLGWWTRLLEDVCLKSGSEVLALQSLQLTTQLAQLLSNHQKYSLARRVLLSARMCIDRNKSLAHSFEMCEHPQLRRYTTMLQLLSYVSAKEGAIDEAHRYNETITKCLRSSATMKAEEIIPHNFCSDGINHVKEVYEKFNDFTSAVQLFDALLKCKESEARSIKLLENAFKVQLAKSASPAAKSMAALRIAKRMHLISNHEREVKWLMRSLQHTTKPHLLFNVYFRLTRLYWEVMNDKQKAIENGKAAYAKATRLLSCHDPIWKAAVRLADVLSQIGHRNDEAMHYFQESLDRLPFVSCLCPDSIYLYQRFIEVNLASESTYFQSRKFSSFFEHSGQWANVGAVAKPEGVGKIFDLFKNLLYAQLANGSSLAIVDNSLDIWWHYLKFHFDLTHNAMPYVQFVGVCILLFLLCVVCVMACVCFSCCCSCALCMVYDFITYRCKNLLCMGLSFVYSFHYFLYIVIVEHKVWKPKHLPGLSDGDVISELFDLLLAVVYLNYWQPLLLERIQQLHNTERYHNVSMSLPDDNIYSDIN